MDRRLTGRVPAQRTHARRVVFALMAPLLGRAIDNAQKEQAQRVLDKRLISTIEREDSPDKVREILRAGANPNAMTSGTHPMPALMVAARKNRLRSGEVLIKEFKARVDERDGEGVTALMDAASHGHTKFAEMLVKNNADPLAMDRYDMTVEAWGLQDGHTKTVEALRPQIANRIIMELHSGNSKPYNEADPETRGYALSVLTESLSDSNKAVQSYALKAMENLPEKACKC